MAKPTVTIDVRGDTKPLKREIDKLAGKKVKLNLDSKNFSAPLGKIKGDLGEFDKSLAASNARVLAFGASAGAIYILQRALTETVKSTIAVEKALAEVNVILGASEKSLARFGGELFNVAKQTGRSFSDVALAAGELARQGLGMEETLKRTSDAMQLARLSGLGVEASVNAITAALNGFRNAALTSTAVIDKIIAVDQAFAVSGADLAEALRRVGSTAEGAGVSLNELLGIVTAAQQITARGGAVIGNSFKTIFTRIQRPKVLEALEELGVKTKDIAGVSLSAIGVLKNLAGTFDTLGDAQRAQIAELVGGVFQINVLKASLRDLGSQYSVFASATDIASKSSGEAARRNATLNQSLSAGLNETLQNLTKLAAGIGKLTLEPAIKNVLGIINTITEKINLGETESTGQSIGKALLGGLGKFLSGPGLAIAAVALFTLFNNLRKFAVDAFRTFTGLNATFKQQQQLQQGIVSILQQNPKILAQIQRGEISVDQAAKQILGSYKGLNSELVSMNSLAAQLAATMSKAGASVGTLSPGGPTTIRTKKKAGGYVPNFADEGEVVAMALSGQYTKSQMANPRTKRGKVHDGQGGSFMATYNGHEKKQDVMGPNGKRGTIIASPAMQKAMAGGYVPNFARVNAKLNQSATLSQVSASNSVNALRGVAGGKNTDPALKKAAQKRIKKLGKRENRVVDVKKKLGFIASSFSGGIEFTNKQAETRKFLGLSGKFKAGDPFISATPRNLVKAQPTALKNGGKVDGGVMKSLRGPIARAILTTSRKLFSPSEKELPNVKKVEKYLGSKAGKEKLALTAGNIFEDAINAGLDLKDKSGGRRWDYVKSDFAKKGTMLKALVGSAKGKELQNLDALEAKLNYPPSNIAETRAKFFDESAGPAPRAIRAAFADVMPRKRKATGFIPNFANALGDAVKRENQAGVTKGAIRVGEDKRLASQSNPLGLAVTNTRDEPRGIKDVLARGYIPNFAQSQNKAKPAKPVGDASGKLFAAMMAASLVTSTFAAAGAESTEGMKKFTTGLNSAVTGLSVLGTAAMMMPGPMGLVVGVLGGLAIAITSYSNAMGVATAAQKANLAALNASTVRLQEQANTIQGAQQALSAYQEALKGADAGNIIAAQRNYSEALNKLTPTLKASLVAEPDKEKKQELLGEAAGKNAQEGKDASEAAADRKAMLDKLDKLNKDKNQKALLVAVGIIGVICAAILVSSKLNKMGRKADKKVKKFDKKNSKFNKDGTVSKRQKNKKEWTKRRNKAGGGMGGKLGQGFNAWMTKAGDKIKSVVKALKDSRFLKSFSKVGRALKVVGRFGGPIAAVLATIAASITIFPKIIGKAFEGLSYIFNDLLGSIPLVGGAFKWMAKGLKFAADWMSEAGSEGIRYLKLLGGWISKTFKKFKGWLGLDFDTSEEEAALGSKYKTKGVEHGISGEGQKAMEQDASKLFDRIDPSKLTTGALEELRKAGAEGEEALKKKLIELGVSAEQASVYVDGAGSSSYALALQIQVLKKNADASVAELARVEASLAAAAAAAAAASRAIESTRDRAKAFTGMLRLLAGGLQDARKRAANFNREFSTELLKGGAGLAKQFQTSFQSTKLEGDIDKIEINNASALKSEKIREQGNKAMFDAVSKNKEVADIFDKVANNAASPEEQQLVNALQNLPITLAGQGAGGVLAGLDQIIKNAQAPGGALEGQNVDLTRSSDVLAALQTQTNAMVEAEQTRQHQLRLSELQTRLAQEQNRIDMQNKAGGGIKAFLDPKSMDKMESGFNQAVDDFTLASGRGDTVKTGQAAGNLLSNLNDFAGGPLMGEGAEGLKDLTQKGLAQSMKGRAFARADVLDQAASETGNQDLAKAADALRNMDFAASAATQVATEFKRQKMPANIEAMLQTQRDLLTLQGEDAKANVNTAKNTAKMARELTGGKFAQAAAQIVSGMPAPEVVGMSEITTQVQAGATAMQAAAQAIIDSTATVRKADDIKDLAQKRKEGAADLEAFIKEANADGSVDEGERVKIEGMVANMAGITAAIGSRIDAMGPSATAAMGQEFIDKEKKRREANAASGITSGNLESLDGATAGNLSPSVRNALESLRGGNLAAPSESVSGASDQAVGISNTTLGTRGGAAWRNAGVDSATGGRFSGQSNISGSELANAATDINKARDAMKRAFDQSGGGASGKDAAIAQAQIFLRQAQREFQQGPESERDVQQVEIAALIQMVKRLESTGSMGNTEKFDMEAFATTMRNGLTANVPVEIVITDDSGKEHRRIITQQVKLLTAAVAQNSPEVLADPTPN